MRLDVALQTLRTHARGLIWWAAGIVSLIAIQFAVYPAVRGQEAYEDIWRDLPEPLQALFGGEGGIDITSGAGYLNAELFGFVLPLLLLIFVTTVGTSAIAGEEERGTMDLLLANPVPRWRVVLEKTGALVVMVTGLVTLAFVTLIVGAPLVDLDVGTAELLAGCTSLLLLAALFAVVAVTLGAVTGRRAFAAGVTAAIALGSFVVNSLSTLASWLEPVRPFTPFRWSTGTTPLRDGFDPMLSVFVPVGAVVVAVGLYVFGRRDVAV